MIRRCWDRISTKIPIGQAAYQAGRSTTEQVFAIKMLAEKAIISSNYIYLLLLDMSKAFDTVSREKLLKDLQEILQPNELHMMSLLVKDVNLRSISHSFSSHESLKVYEFLSAILCNMKINKVSQATSDIRPSHMMLAPIEYQQICFKCKNL